jgi:hypothetical protein
MSDPIAVTVTWTVTVELLATDPDVVNRTRGQGPMAAEFEATMGWSQQVALASLARTSGILGVSVHDTEGWADLPDSALDVEDISWDLESVAVDGEYVTQ